MKYETYKHDGTLPIIGVNTFLRDSPEPSSSIELIRSTQAEKERQIARLGEFKAAHRDSSAEAIVRLKQSIAGGGNGFEALMDAVKCCSLGELTDAFFEIGGQYRRST